MPVTDGADDGLLHTEDGMGCEFVSFDGGNDGVDLFAWRTGVHDDHHGDSFPFLFFVGAGFPRPFKFQQYIGRGDLAPTYAQPCLVYSPCTVTRLRPMICAI